MAAIDNVYQYYLSTYGNSTVSRYDTHKKSELRDIYNRIIKINKESPLYKVKNTKDVKKHAIDIKESAKSLQNVISSLSDENGGIEDIFSKRIAQSSNEDVITAEYIGKENADNANHTGFEISVRQLASNQINLGNYLNPNRLDIEAGTYDFDLNTTTSSYEFQYTVNRDDTNATLLHKLVNLVNTARIGLSASTTTNESGQIALQIASKQTGITENEDYLFQVLPTSNPASVRAMRTLGIQQVAKEASNSSFLLNGVEHASYANTFTVDNAFDVTLHGTNKDDETTTIGFKANADAIADNIQRLTNAYNGIIGVAYAHSEDQNSKKLIRDISGAAKAYHNELEAIGINIEKDSSLSIDKSLLTDAVTSGDAEECFSILNRFKNTLNEKTKTAFIDPMNYVNKLVVAYKNPGRNFPAPYITSIYSGMMLDQYC